MSEPKQKNPEGRIEPETEVPLEAVENGDPETGEESPPPSEAEQIVALEAEVGELKDQLLRAMAETENLRRRGQREREEAVRYAAAALIRDLLPVADNLSRALESVSAEAPESAESMKTLLDGVKLTERELQAAFGRHNIVKLDPFGERLDPHRHEALFEIPDPETVAGTIVQVIQSGYLLHDRLLRPARVGLARGGPSPTDAPKASAEPQDGAEADPEATAEPGTEPGSRVDTSA